MKPFTFISVASLLSAATAIPNVAPKLISRHDSCGGWPQRFDIFVDSSDDAAINNLPLQPRNIPFASGVLPILAVDLRASRRIAKYLYACNNGRAAVASSPTFMELGIYKDRNNGEFLTDAATEKVLVPELYKHVVDGKELDGIYLGANNLTTWGFNYHGVSCSYENVTVSPYDCYEAKLQGLPNSDYDSAGYEIEFNGFLKVVPY